MKELRSDEGVREEEEEETEEEEEELLQPLQHGWGGMEKESLRLEVEEEEVQEAEEEFSVGAEEEGWRNKSILPTVPLLCLMCL
jgi:hypothetical protein